MTNEKAIITYHRKRDINGNQYSIVVNHENASMKGGYGIRTQGEIVTVTMKDQNAIFAALLAAGYSIEQ